MAKKHFSRDLPLETGNPAENLWNVHEMALFLRKSAHAVYKMVERRQIPYFKVRQAVRFNPVAIRAWLQRHAVRPDPSWDGR